MTLYAASGARCTGKHVYDDLAVVFAAGSACRVRQAESPAFAAGGALSGQSMMTPALACLGAVYPHSDYHGREFRVFEP